MFKLLLQILTALSELLTRAEVSRLAGQQATRFMLPITQVSEPTNLDMPEWVREIRDGIEATTSPNPLVNPEYVDMKGTYYLYRTVFEHMCDAQLTELEARMLRDHPDQWEKLEVEAVDPHEDPISCN